VCFQVDATFAANSGHPGAPMGMAPVAHVLFNKFMTFNPKNPDWVNRDRFVLSYVILFLVLVLCWGRHCQRDASQGLRSGWRLKSLNSYCGYLGGDARFQPQKLDSASKPGLTH
jgi:hypothetical protein